MIPTTLRERIEMAILSYLTDNAIISCETRALVGIIEGMAQAVIDAVGDAPVKWPD